MDVAEFKALADKRIEGAQKQRDAWTERFKNTKAKVNEVLSDATTIVLEREAKISGIDIDEYIKTLPEYANMKKENQNQDMNKDDFFNKIKDINMGLYCDILGRFTSVSRMNNGTDKIDKDLEDAYDIKSSKKSALKQRANEILKLYDDILKFNAEEIERMQAKINDKKATIKELINKRTAENNNRQKGKRSEEEIKESEKVIKRIDEEIENAKESVKTLEEDLSAIILQNEEYRITIGLEKSKFADEVKDATQVDIGGSDAAQPASSDNGTQSAGASTSNAIRKTINTNDKEKNIAKRMLLDIRNMDTASRTTLINQYGYEDLYQMTKCLGPLGRSELKRMLDQAIKKENIKFNNAEIKNGKINNTDIEFLEKEIQDFMRNIDSKTYTEIREFEAKIEQINMIALSQAASFGKFKQFFNRFTRSGINFNNLNLALKKFSNLRYDRETAALNATNAMRSKIHAAPVQDSRSRTYVDKNRKGPIYDNRER